MVQHCSLHRLKPAPIQIHAVHVARASPLPALPALLALPLAGPRIHM